MHTTPNELSKVLQWRYATKQFDTSKKIDKQTLEALTDSLQLSPSSYGLQPWKFIVVTNEELKKELRTHSWDQAQITDCSHVVVHCVLKNLDKDYVDTFIQSIAKQRGVPLEELAEYKQLMLGSIEQKDAEAWNTRQVYISNGFLLLAAAQLGVDACPMEGFNAAKYDEALGLTDSGFGSVVITALGYRSNTDEYATKAKVRFSKDEIITFKS